MDHAEAEIVLADELARYRGRSYNRLLPLLEQQETFEVTGRSGTTYQIEIEAMWDNGRGGNLRVCAYIDDGGARSLLPLTADFIVAPDGGLIDE